MLQMYQAKCLAERKVNVSSDSPTIPLLNEVSIATAHITHVSRCFSLSLRRWMASTVVAQRQFWLTLDCAVCLEEPTSADGLYGQSPDATHAKFMGGKLRLSAASFPDLMLNPNNLLTCMRHLACNKGLPCSLEKGTAAEKNASIILQ